MARTLHGCPTASADCVPDHVLIDLLGRSARRARDGDIVVFRARGWGESDGTFISRVIAAGGQTVRGDAAGRVMISSHGPGGPWTTLTEPYVLTDGATPATGFGPVTVPEGRYWVMGDHRADSADSRFHCGTDGTLGDSGSACNPVSSTIAAQDVIGVAVKIVSPPNRARPL